MNLDEFAFVNRQLAGMLKSGIPLEGALRQVCAEMRRGELWAELQALEADLARGTPLRDALAARRLPSFYAQMLQVGAQSNDLPGVLTMLADYYQRLHLAWMRLKGLLVYPLLVLGTSFAVSLMVATIYGRILADSASQFAGLFAGPRGVSDPAVLLINIWLPAVLLGLLCLMTALMLTVPSWRQWLRWRFPAFREARLSQLASAFALMLENGCNFDQALNMVRELEAGSPVRRDLDQWQIRLSTGTRKFADLAAGGKTVPPLFVWLVAGSGEDWAGGFKQAAQIYFDRAAHRVDLLLYSILPVSVLLLGLLIVGQVLPVLRVFMTMFQLLGDMGMSD